MILQRARSTPRGRRVFSLGRVDAGLERRQLKTDQDWHETPVSGSPSKSLQLCKSNRVTEESAFLSTN